MNQGLIVFAVIALSWAPAQGQDRLLPADTSFVVVVNAREALKSKPIRELVIPWYSSVLLKVPHLGQLINILGIDPLRNLWTVSIATSSTRDQDRIIIVLRGSWDRQALSDQLKEKSRRADSGLALGNLDSQAPIYKWSRTGGKPGPIFVSLTKDGGIVSSLSKDYLEQVIKPNSKADLSDRRFQESIATMNPRDLVFVAVSGNSIDWSMVPEGKARDTFKSSRGLAGHLNLNQAETELNLEFFLESADKGTASSNKQALDDLAGQSLGYIGMMINQQPQYKLIHTALKSNRNDANGNNVRIRMMVPISEVRELLNPGQPRQGKQD